ncbi:MAG: Crp/Fnr family transcriptional regulator [Bdellovibrionaceae bacterium]|nr:Crp/Fnr family transcriptional regulator [Pseudobdellovibrionaceae bacterium]
MAGGVKKLGKNDVLFREGDASDAMYVIKSGRIAITKAKGSGEIILAEKAGGEMLGEMAFFDNKPRSAGAKALQDTEVIALPFSSLHAQFKTFPEWLKAMVKTINGQLRDANTRIKNLEAATTGVEEMFPPHVTTRLCAIISLIGFKCGEKTETGLVVPYNVLRDYCIQIFQQPTNKLDRLMDVLQAIQIMKVEDLGEGRKRITIVNHKVLSDFTDWYNRYLFTDKAKQVTVEEKELQTIRALIFYGKKTTPDDKGFTKVSLTDMQNSSMRDLNFLFSVNDADPLAEKGLVQEKSSEQGGVLTMKFKMSDLETILPFWEIVYTLKKVPGRG